MQCTIVRLEAFSVIGATLSHYRITEKLGEGGMGVVYRAEDTRLQRKVALKVIGEGMLADPTARARLVREAQLASALNHPNICTVYEADESEGQALYHQYNGDYEQSQALWKPILDSDPMFFPARVNMGDLLRQMGDPAGSIREQEKVLELDPKNMLALTALALAYQTQGNTAGAREALARAGALEPQNYQVRLLLALQLAVEGKSADAVREMDSEVLKYGEFIMVASVVAEFYAVLEDKAKSLEWLDRAVRAGDERADWFKRDPLLSNVQNEPRFRQIMDGIRYQQEQQAKSER